MNIPNYEDITALLEKGLTVEAREKIMCLKEVTLTLQEENLALKQQLVQFEKAVNGSRNLHFERGVYWRRASSDPDSTILDGPFCQVCYDKDKKAVHLHRHAGSTGIWYCAACHNEFW